MRVLSTTDARRKGHALLLRTRRRYEDVARRYGADSLYLGELRRRLGEIEGQLQRLDSSTPGDVETACYNLTIWGDV